MLLRSKTIHNLASEDDRDDEVDRDSRVQRRKMKWSRLGWTESKTPFQLSSHFHSMKSTYSQFAN